jgi:hypothetical protein
MSLRRTLLQFSLRSLLLCTFLAIVIGQSYRIVVHDRRVRAERAALVTKVEAVIARNHDRPPRCAILQFGVLCRELDESSVYQQMPALQRTALGSRIEAERFHHFNRGDQMTGVSRKPMSFTKVDDMLTQNR